MYSLASSRNSESAHDYKGDINMAIISCPECGREVSDQAAACINCGNPIASGNANMKFCKFCSERIHADAVMCPKCGRQVEELKAEKNSQPVVYMNAGGASSSSSSSSSAAASGHDRVPYRQSCLLHIILFIFTGGIGNIIYYFWARDRYY